jgi:hypothetical protein
MLDKELVIMRRITYLPTTFVVVGVVVDADQRHSIHDMKWHADTGPMTACGSLSFPTDPFLLSSVEEGTILLHYNYTCERILEGKEVLI